MLASAEGIPYHNIQLKLIMHGIPLTKAAKATNASEGGTGKFSFSCQPYGPDPADSSSSSSSSSAGTYLTSDYWPLDLTTATGTQFTCFTRPSTKVQISTPEELRAGYWLPPLFMLLET
jgi:hypothetical protein